jgi:CrcB protein
MSGFAPWFAVAVGSAVGGVLRYGAARLWPMVPGGWPLSTMAVNLIGCLAIGVLSVVLAARETAPEVSRLFWMVGVLGGFTTYSTFAIETVFVAESGQLARAVGYAVVTLAGCVGAAWLGRSIAGHWY